MNIEKTIYGILTSNPIVAALVGNRVSPVVGVQAQSSPYITYQEIDDIKFHTVDGSSGWRESRWQLNCWSTSYDSMVVLAKAIEKALDCYVGGGIDHIFCIDRGDLPLNEAENENLVMYGKRIDFEFFYNES